jgi:photosystem II stability/assembly factor-like uncharacterized protein
MKRAIVVLFMLVQHCFAQNWKLQQVVPETEASFRGLSVVDDSVAWVSGSKGWVGRSINGGQSWTYQKVKGFEQCDFRSLYAFDAKRAIIANAGSPAYILVTNDGGATWQQVYEDRDSLAFFDGIDFWNNKEGIIYGDPKDGHIEMLRTNDGGLTWKELPQISRPTLAKGEASFAASGTTIRCLKHGRTVIATGGKVSRLLYSKNRGKSWKPIAVPIIQGESTTGIFSVAYLNKKKAMVVGGDYKQEQLMKDHVFYTNDGGKNWIAPSKPTRGYRECVTYVDKRIVIAVGPSGFDISYDGGKSWQPFSNEKQYHVIKKARKGNCVIAAGGSGKIARLQPEE